jgi:sugar lactone lactonase YvrE
MAEEVECIFQGRDLIGESPVWSVAEQSLYWVDIKRPAIRRLDAHSRQVTDFELPEAVGSIGLRVSGGLVAALRSGLHGFDPATGRLEVLARFTPATPAIRFNDGKCDRAGRFWCGTLEEGALSPIGELYRFDADHSVSRHADGFILLNGMAWSPDNRLMYVADSRREIVYAYDFSLDTGELGARRPFISTEDVPGRVDGATVAEDGSYWCAHVRGGQVAQYDPDGRLVQAIALPVKYPLMCTFGGAGMDVLYVTTSAALVTPEEAPGQPLAGSLFAIYGCGSRGISEPFYAG